MADDALRESYVEEDFYSILGVSPRADAKEIKRAYYGLMRSCHPDRSGDDGSTEFCALLNEVYDTLVDPGRRQLYDELAGFSMDSINPFLDASYERDQVFVDEFTCIGCRNCNNVCPQTFGMEEEWGRARVMQQGVDTESKLQEAIDTCPVSCIHWVTTPQLSLLEAAMARMERVAVWNLMGGGGNRINTDVFTEASLAWTKRQAEIRARRDVAQAGWTFFGSMVQFDEGSSGSRFYEQAGGARTRAEQAAASGGDRETRSVASLAVRAARAARTWKRYQDVTQAARRDRSMISVSSAASMDIPD